MQNRKADGVSFIKIVCHLLISHGDLLLSSGYGAPEIYTWGLFSLSPYHNSLLFSKGLRYMLHLDMPPNKDVLETSPKH